MATFVSGYLNDLSGVKDNIRLRVRILQTWMVDDIFKKGAKKLELIVMDEHNTRMQASVRSGLVNKFKHKLEEGKPVTLQLYSLQEIQPRYRMLNKPLRLSILHNTEIEACDDFTGSMYGFDFRSYRSITDLKHEEVGQFDIIGHVVACEDLDTYDKNGKPGKKKPLTLMDVDGNELKCTLWSAFAQQFSDFLGTCSDHSKIIVVLQFAMMKMWDGHMCVQNAFNATKLFTFDCTQPILDETFIDVKEYSQRLFANHNVSESDDTASRISTASKNSTKENFVSRIPPKNIAELLDVDQGVNSIIVGSIIAINEEEGWWYIGCKGCKKKVIRSSDMVDLEVDISKKKTDVKEDWFCTKCNAVPNIKTMFRIQVRVQDETGSVSLTLWNDEIQPAIGSSAYQLCEKYGKSETADIFPTEITKLVGKKFAFKVFIDEYNAKKLLPVFTVLRLSDDPDIIDSIRPTTTPTKESGATSSFDPSVSQLDLESQTDENTTPVNTGKNFQATSGGKRPAVEDVGSESSNSKKMAVAVKIEKDA